MKKLISMLIRLPGHAMIAVVRFYQVTLSPFVGWSCRFTPTCSNYMIEAIRKYGAVRGGGKGVLRLLRCQPWHRGGYDPP